MSRLCMGVGRPGISVLRMGRLRVRISRPSMTRPSVSMFGMTPGGFRPGVRMLLGMRMVRRPPWDGPRCMIIRWWSVRPALGLTLSSWRIVAAIVPRRSFFDNTRKRRTCQRK